MLPNLVIIGAMKSGTLSLHKYLSLHPEISMAPIHELDYFVEERNWSRGLDWYKSIFTKPARITGERSTSYTKYPTFKGVPERMSMLIPGAKLIYCIRDPLTRLVSQYVHWYARRYENEPFEAAIRRNNFENEYIYYSRYYFQLEQYLKCFPESQIQVISLEDMARDRLGTLRQVFEFLNVDPSFQHDDFTKVHHKSSELRRATLFRLRFGKLRGMYRLSKTYPWLFERHVKRPKIGKELHGELLAIFREDLEKIKPYLAVEPLKAEMKVS
jgi:hypothetical protein